MAANAASRFGLVWPPRSGWSAGPFALAILMIAGALIWPQLAFAGPPFRTDDPEPVEFHHFEIDLYSQATRTDGGWSGQLPGFEVDYGLIPNLQLHAIVPQGFTVPSGGRTGLALDDIELGAKYRLITPGKNDWFPQVAVFPLIELPTGNRKLGFNTGHAQVFLPVWLEKDFGAWTVYGGGGYWINPGAGNRNFGFVGIAVWRQVTDKLSLGVEVFNQTSPADGVPDSTGFDFGAIYDISDNWHLLVSSGRGAQNPRLTNQFSYYVGLRLTF